MNNWPILPADQEVWRRLLKEEVERLKRELDNVRSYLDDLQLSPQNKDEPYEEIGFGD